MTKIRTYIAMIILAAAGFSVSASTFTLMSVEEISTLLGNREFHPSKEDSSGAMTKKCNSESRRSMPRIVSAMDMVSKVYGAVSPEMGKSECMRRVEETLSLTPHEEDGNLWLDSADGYNLSYNGIMPEVAAIANFAADDTLNEYCYFFIFPYTNSGKEETIDRQARFTGSLLQEIYDNGCDPGVNLASDDLMEVTGSHENSFLNIRLVDDNSINGENRYILMLIVQPNAYSAADEIAAL